MISPLGARASCPADLSRPQLCGGGAAAGRLWWDGVTRIDIARKPLFISPCTAALKVFPRCFVSAGRTVGGARSRRLCGEEHEPAGDSPQHQHRRH